MSCNDMQCSGEIDAGILVDISQTNVKTLMTAMKNKSSPMFEMGC